MPIIPRINKALVADLHEVEALTDHTLLLDARAPERYSGEVETIDARAGHIPHAINAPWMENLTSSSLPVFKTAQELRQRWESLGLRSGENAICYCGSGVTACHDLLAMEIAGLHGARLYPGSWSEWVATHPA